MNIYIERNQVEHQSETPEFNSLMINDYENHRFTISNPEHRVYFQDVINFERKAVTPRSKSPETARCVMCGSSIYRNFTTMPNSQPFLQ